VGSPDDLIMLPENVASSLAIPSAFLDPDTRLINKLTDFEMGGVGIADASQGLLVQAWSAYLVDDDVFIKPDGGSPTLLISRVGITELSFTFDQNMRPMLAFVDATGMNLWWYDPTLPGYTFTVFGEARNPRITMDDKRPEALATISDAILGYIRGDTLYYRQQRDRFQVERALRVGVVASVSLRNIGLSHNLRLQFELV
jgi:hypothetical protein